jgi:putative transposase
MNRINDTLLPGISEMLSDQSAAGLSKVLEVLLNQVMLFEREKHLKAASYERTDLREGYANGFKDKQLKTRVGELSLSVPQTRDSDFYPSCLEKGLRCERALKLALAEMYVQGVSTRKVAKITEELCGFEISRNKLVEHLSCWIKSLMYGVIVH